MSNVSFGDYTPEQTDINNKWERFLFAFDNGYRASVGKFYDEDKWEVAALGSDFTEWGTYEVLDIRTLGFSNTVQATQEPEGTHAVLVDAPDVAVILDTIKALPAHQESVA